MLIAVIRVINRVC